MFNPAKHRYPKLKKNIVKFSKKMPTNPMFTIEGNILIIIQLNYAWCVCMVGYSVWDWLFRPEAPRRGELARVPPAIFTAKVGGINWDRKYLFKVKDKTCMHSWKCKWCILAIDLHSSHKHTFEEYNFHPFWHLSILKGLQICAYYQDLPLRLTFFQRILT